MLMFRPGPCEFRNVYLSLQKRPPSTILRKAPKISLSVGHTPGTGGSCIAERAPQDGKRRSCFPCFDSPSGQRYNGERFATERVRNQFRHYVSRFAVPSFDPIQVSIPSQLASSSVGTEVTHTTAVLVSQHHPRSIPSPSTPNIVIMVRL
jgi:hypothetical protein